MFLKTLALRGFKSFAEKTVLDLEPGITVVVGPNGSGKSNIVDALTWVLGSSSPRALRGGAMADVIFAGSAGQGRHGARPALGRAAVDITIDNGQGLLPIAFSEVTVGRAVFASGESSYGINGVECRALDVQELLSDTGLGREHHTIVGQGQLDAVLGARPEERRALIEEAAGILKHRRRKERALRKLAQVEAHVERLTDVLRELERGLKPLERQAAAAARHAELSAALADVRLRRALRTLAALTARLEEGAAGRASTATRIAALDDELRASRDAEAALERNLARLAPTARAATEAHVRLAGLVERSRGLVERIGERRAGLAAAGEEPVAGRGPEQLRARAADQRAALADLSGARAAARDALAAAEADRRDAERARRAHEQASAAEARRRAEARERFLRWEGEVAALRSGLAQAAGEEGRLAGQATALDARAAALAVDLEAAEAALVRREAATGAARDALEAAEAVATERAAAVADATAAERDLERRRASAEARADALRAASRQPGQGVAALVAAAEDGALGGLDGTLAERLEVDAAAARAVAAVLGPLADAVVTVDRDAAADAVEVLRDAAAGRVLLVPAREPAPAPGAAAAPTAAAALAAAGARPLVDALRADPEVAGTVRTALAGVWLVEDFAAARGLAAAHPALTLVTPGGEVVGAGGYAGGQATAGSALVSRAAAERAEAERDGVATDLAAAARRLAVLRAALDDARAGRDAAAAAVHAADGQVTAAASGRTRLRAELDTCERQRAALRAQVADLAREVTGRRERLAALEARCPGDAPAGDDTGGDLEAERLEDVLAAAREAEVQARLAAGAVDQRVAQASDQVDDLEREADEVERRLAERERRRCARLAAIARCDELAAVAAAALARTERSLEAATGERDRLEDDRGARQRQLGALRGRLTDLEAERAGLVADRHAEELVTAELRHALDGVRDRIRTVHGRDPDAALAAARAGGDDGQLAGGDDVDAELEEAEERLARTVGLLGAVNPLALQELAERRERATFLTEQLDDLRAARRDLLAVVEAVDARVRDVFGAAFADVAAAFSELFPRLFPGGEGRLVLTDPDDLLTTGVEVEARPPGKRVKRLSLLSGGERSLTALAVLFAIFTARPSPFYVLDEVEAALDDVNLQRFLDVLVDFTRTSQLLVVTHQRRTMEIADTLYGVSMRSDGVSRVVVERLGAGRRGAGGGGSGVTEEVGAPR